MNSLSARGATNCSGGARTGNGLRSSYSAWGEAFGEQGPPGQGAESQQIEEEEEWEEDVES